MGEDRLKDQRIQEILEIEKNAQAIYEQAVKEAEQLPVQAEKEAQGIIDKARADAEEEARKMLEKAKAEDEIGKISADAEEKVKHAETLAATNFDRAVAYVLNRVVGKE
jgi:V/A-type H+/Na+-transporting ATPase subunit G/H